MTWHHVAALLIAATLTIAVVFSPHGTEQIIREVFAFDGGLTIAVFANAGTARIQRRELHKEETDQERR